MFTSLKDSKSLLKPQLARQYESAHLQVYKNKVVVSKGGYRQFIDAERKLRRHGIGSKDYAFWISNRLYKWVCNKRFVRLPVNVFCGDWAIALYRNEALKATWEVTDSDIFSNAMLVHDELRVARYYAAEYSNGRGTLLNAVTDLFPLLGSEWLELFQGRKREAITVAALDLLSKEQGRSIETYDDL